jgi:hypothetical protein
MTVEAFRAVAMAVKAAVSGVRTRPGATPLTRIPRGRVRSPDRSESLRVE